MILLVISPKAFPVLSPYNPTRIPSTSFLSASFLPAALKVFSSFGSSDAAAAAAASPVTFEPSTTSPLLFFSFLFFFLISGSAICKEYAHV